MNGLCDVGMSHIHNIHVNISAVNEKETVNPAQNTEAAASSNSYVDYNISLLELLNLYFNIKLT